MVHLLADLKAPALNAMRVHEDLELLDARGLRVERHMRTPEACLAWIDAEFGPGRSGEAFVGGAYLAWDDAGLAAVSAFDARGTRFPGWREWEKRPEVGVLGPLGVAPRARGKGVGEILLRGALFSLRERGYEHALIPCVEDEELIAFYRRHAGARIVEEHRGAIARAPYRTVVLASGNGSNFQAVIDAMRAERLPLDLRALVTNRADAYAIRRAEAASISVRVRTWDRANETRAAYDAALSEIVAACEPEMILLLGWMHVLSPAFLERFPQVLNVHPAVLPLDATLDRVTMPDGEVLPAFRGARAIDDALAHGARWFGASVHRVTAEVDRGEVLVRGLLLRWPGETRESLLERIHALEHGCVIEGIARWMRGMTAV